MVVGVKISVSNRDLRAMEWKFCPVCGTPKPVEKELAEKLYESTHGGSEECYPWKN